MTVKDLRDILLKLPDEMEVELNIHEYPFRELKPDAIVIYEGALILNLHSSYAFAVSLVEYDGD